MTAVNVYEHQSMASPAAYFEVKMSPTDLDHLITALGMKQSSFHGRGDMAVTIPAEAPWFDVSTLGWPIHQFEVFQESRQIVVWTNESRDKAFIASIY
jgi:hypothetical protein